MDSSSSLSHLKGTTMRANQFKGFSTSQNVSVIRAKHASLVSWIDTGCNGLGQKLSSNAMYSTEAKLNDLQWEIAALMSSMMRG